jgi:hypothetical protein
MRRGDGRGVLEIVLQHIKNMEEMDKQNYLEG